MKAGTPTDEDLEGLANAIGINWKRLACRLGFSEPLLEEIDLDNQQLVEKTYQMFKYWKQRQGAAATYKVLRDALAHDLVARQDLAEKFCYD